MLVLQRLKMCPFLRRELRERNVSRASARHLGASTPEAAVDVDRKAGMPTLQADEGVTHGVAKPRAKSVQF